MKKIARWGLSLLVICALAAPGFAQNITDQAEYNAYMGVFNEKDPAKKAGLAEKFLADYPKTDARTQAYQMLILSFAQVGNWAKSLEWADKQSQYAPNLDEGQKKQILLIGMTAAGNVKNNAKTVEYAEKLLAAEPANFGALITLSGILSTTIPATDPQRSAHLIKTLDITNRALAQKAKPQGYADAQWNGLQVQLHRTACLVLLNQQKYTDSMAECRAAVNIDPRDGDSWYLIGMALKPELVDLVKRYQDANTEYNNNRDKGQLIVEELKARMDGALQIADAKKNETLDAFARSVVAGGGAAAQAKQELQKIFTGTPDELNLLIEQKRGQLGN